MLSTVMQPMQVSMMQLQLPMLRAWLVLALGFFDHSPSCVLRRVVDEMVDTGWIAKSTYFLIPQWGSRTPKGPPCRYGSFESY